MNVFKFGGASVKDAQGVKNVATVLQQTGHTNLVIVVSAMGKMTNALEGVVNSYFQEPAKVKQAIELFDAIHTVDRLKLAQKLSNEIQSQGKAPEMFIQINTGEEEQKSGISPKDADQFIANCLSLDLPIKGLMVIPPVNEEPSLHFGLLKKIAQRNGLEGLSMGMSSDFESAIAMGATHIRVGSAIFGERDYS